MSAVTPRQATDDLPRSRLTGAFERRVGRVLDAQLEPGAPVVVACSGGPDSTAALVATARARGSRGGAVVAACFDHRMRPRAETTADRAFVQTLAGRLGVPMRSGAASAGSTAAGEAEAREARYRWLAAVCRGAEASACVTGHTLDDQAETVLLRLARGSGLTGAGAMAEASPWPVAVAGAPLTLLRPLLRVGRERVLDYLDSLEIEARRDPSNELLTFDRNRVRHRVLAELRKVNPRAAEQIARFARLAREDEEALGAWAEQSLRESAMFGSGRAKLERRALREAPPAIGSRMLRLAADGVGLQLDGSQVEQLLGIARQKGRRASLAGGEAWTDEEWLHLSRGHAASGETSGETSAGEA
jgi:tRNA(Ile)-lysidine synthase